MGITISSKKVRPVKRGKVADAAILLRDEASKRNERFNLEVDFKKIDAKAQDSLTKAKATRAKKLNGQ